MIRCLVIDVDEQAKGLVDDYEGGLDNVVGRALGSSLGDPSSVQHLSCGLDLGFQESGTEY